MVFKDELQTGQEAKGVFKIDIDAEGNYICTNKHGREYRYPSKLVFKRKSGKIYAHISREISGYPAYLAKDKVKSLETGKIKEMSSIDMEIFINS